MSRSTFSQAADLPQLGCADNIVADISATHAKRPAPHHSTYSYDPQS